MSIWKLTDKDPVKITGEILTEGTSTPLPENTAGLSHRAELLIAAGEYFTAMELYLMHVRKEPSNMQVRQQAEELRSLILFSGLQKDFIIFRLERFRDLIRKGAADFWKT
ncbi:MAG: hypothetical protein EPN25_09120 [Nitrospirae bacterium]|nr:MAG: hypothetical protein EPN25_09120 [Nitrospirota bacterium]